MRTFREYWGRIFSRLQKPPVSDTRQATGSEHLERERSAETVRETNSRKILDLERRLAEIEAGRNQARDKVNELEDSLEATTLQLERTDRQVQYLRVSSEEQANLFKASLSDASTRLESTDTHVRELEDRMANERQDYLKTFQLMQGRFSKQDVRMNWAIAVAGFALLLGTVAGAVLIWDVQKNATLLSSMSQDINELMSSVNGHLSMQHTLQEEQRQLALPATSPEPGTTVTAKQASGTAAESQPAPSAKTTISAADPPPNSIDSAPDRALSTNREGILQFTRRDAKAFFEENAKVEGVVSLPSGVQYRLVNSGSGKSPSLSDKVVVTYVGVKFDGAVFDETYSNGAPSTFSMNELLPGWREVLLKMEEGAEFELYIPPNLATKGGVRKRGMLGFEPNIYLIELLEVVKEGATDPAAPEN